MTDALLSKNCNLFEIDPRNTDGSLLSSEELLKLYLIDLEKVYNNTTEPVVAEEEKESAVVGDDDNDHKSASKFKECKEKALETLLKAEQTNAYLDTLTSNCQQTGKSSANKSQIEQILDDYQTKKQRNLARLINFYREFELDVNKLKGRGHSWPKLAEFVGMHELADYLDNTLSKLTGNWSAYELCNALIYGPSGSGKESFVMSYLLDKGWLKFNQSKSKTCSSFVKIFFVDFKSSISWWQNETAEQNDEQNKEEGSFLHTLFSSIDLYLSKKRLSSLIIFKNIEFLIEKSQSLINTSASTSPRLLRFIGDLLFQIGTMNVTSFLNNNKLVNLNKSVFLIIANSPWIIPRAVGYKFKAKLFVRPFDREHTQQMFEHFIAKMVKSMCQRDWLFVNELEAFVERFALSEQFAKICAHRLNGRLAQSLANKCERQIELDMNEAFRCLLQATSPSISWDVYETFKKETEQMRACRKRTSIAHVRNNNNHWRNVRSQLSVIRKFSSSVRKVSQIARRSSSSSRRHTLVETTSADHDHDHLATGRVLIGQRLFHAQEASFSLMKREFWREQGPVLLSNLTSTAQDFLNHSSLSEDFIAKFDNFMSSSAF
jgi:hypothetical protein